MDLMVNLDVDDLTKAIAFYEGAFGLRVGRRLGASVVEMLGSSAPIYLLMKAEGTPAASAAPQPRTYQRHWTLGPRLTPSCWGIVPGSGREQHDLAPPDELVIERR